MKLRWIRDTTTKPDVLQVWVQRARYSEAGAIDYSSDGVWEDVPLVVMDSVPQQPSAPAEKMKIR